MLGNLEHSQSNEGERGALARAVGREIAGWKGHLWVEAGWRELGGGCAACAVSVRLSSQGAKLPKFPGMLHQGFAAALYFTPLFSRFSFITEP